MSLELRSQIMVLIELVAAARATIRARAYGMCQDLAELCASLS